MTSRPAIDRLERQGNTLSIKHVKQRPQDPQIVGELYEISIGDIGFVASGMMLKDMFEVFERFIDDKPDPNYVSEIVRSHETFCIITDFGLGPQ